MGSKICMEIVGQPLWTIHEKRWMEMIQIHMHCQSGDLYSFHETLKYNKRTVNMVPLNLIVPLCKYKLIGSLILILILYVHNYIDTSIYVL